MKILVASITGDVCRPVPAERWWKHWMTAQAQDDSPDDGFRRKTLREWPLWSGLTCREEAVTHVSDSPPRPFKMTSVFNVRGEYVGDVAFARHLVARGITPELKDSSLSVCSIGFCAREQKWAGWSHRALVMFGIGDRVFDEAYGDDHTPYTQHGAQEITTLDEAKLSAIKFADHVS